jgi:hypothetical protein
MTAQILHLSGLHGASLAAFERTVAIVDANLRRIDPEEALRQMRAHLEQARQLFPVSVEQADAYGAMAANKLSVALRMGEA